MDGQIKVSRGIRRSDALMGRTVIWVRPEGYPERQRVGTIISAEPLELWINGHTFSETLGRFSVHVAFRHGNEWVELRELRPAKLSRGMFVPEDVE